MADSLTKKTFWGVLWSAIDSFASKGISFLLSIVLARLLSPSDYGTIAMITIFIAISQALVDSGFSSAVVRKKNRTQEDLSVAFYCNIIIGLICYSILFFAAPLIAKFYDNTQLVGLTRLMGLVFLFFSLSNIQQAVLAIEVNFKLQTKISLLSVSLSGIIGVLFAYHGYGAWSLAWQQVCAAGLRCLFLFLYLKWRPLLVFSKDSFMELASFGSKVLGVSLLNSFCNNIYSLVIGKIYKPDALGYYSRADQFCQFSSVNLTSIIKRVTFPVFSIIQDNPNKLREAYLRVSRILVIVLFPILVFLFFTSKCFFPLLLTEKWNESILLFQLLVISYLFYPLYTMNLNVIEVKGEGNVLLKCESISKTVNIVALLASLPFGLVGVCAGRIIYALISYFLSSFFASKLLNVTSKDLLNNILPILFVSIISASFSFLICTLVEGYLLYILFFMVSMFTCYFFIIKLLFPSYLEDIRNIRK